MSWRDTVPAGSDRAVVAAAAAGWLALLVAPAALDLPALCGRASATLAADPAAWRLLAALLSPTALAAAWVAMAVAMMLPLAAPQLRHLVARGGPAAPCGVAAFVAGWLAVWLAALAALEAAAALLMLGLGGVAPVAALLLAFAWQHAPAKQRGLRRCHACPPLPWSAAALAATGARLGLATGAACVTGCWAIMLAAMTFAPGEPAMIAAAAVLWVERYWHRAPLGLAGLLPARG